MAERFRIEVVADGDMWEATVYDLADHGPDTPYASVWGGSLERVLRDAAHYVLVAAAEEVAP